MSAVKATKPEEPDELQQRNQELIFARTCLSRFTYAISHELNSPVHTMNGLLEILCSENREQLDSAGKELLDMVLVSARRTQGMVTGILEYSKSVEPLGEMTDVDSRLLLDDVLLELAPKLQKNNANINIGDMPRLNTSINGMKQIFRQLISNAIKFIPDNAQPNVSIYARTESLGVEFVVCDRGIGINPEEARESIFGLFTRLHARSEFEGAGLGLSITLQIVHALNGRIWVTQEPEGGSAFHVFLPSS